MNNKWTAGDVEILKNSYSFETKEVILTKLFPKKWSHIVDKASDLKLKREVYYFSEK